MIGHPHTAETKIKMSKSKMGDKNPRWNGGTSEYPNHAVLKKVRLEVLKDARGKCEICGEHANIVHHIDSSNNNHDLKNLISVCNKCHKALHRDDRDKGEGTSKLRREYGMTAKEIALYFGVLPHTVYNWLRTSAGREKILSLKKNILEIS